MVMGIGGHPLSGLLLSLSERLKFILEFSGIAAGEFWQHWSIRHDWSWVDNTMYWYKLNQ